MPHPDNMERSRLAALSERPIGLSDGDRPLSGTAYGYGLTCQDARRQQLHTHFRGRSASVPLHAANKGLLSHQKVPKTANLAPYVSLGSDLA